jgi:hypothetical protein
MIFFEFALGLLWIGFWLYVGIWKQHHFYGARTPRELLGFPARGGGEPKS